MKGWYPGYLICNSFPSKEQASFNFGVAATIHSDFRAKKIKAVTTSTFSMFTCYGVIGLDAIDQLKKRKHNKKSLFKM